jgi:exonuclease SbcC
MIPLSLTIKGLYSYKTEQTIDFQPLLDGKLFGFFGNVGSGKSSILEAITFALYGETERLNKQENRGYNMMNLQSDEWLIDFTCKLGQENLRYRLTATCKRDKKSFDKVSTIDRKAFVEQKGSWLPIETSRIPEITGLSYDNFKRTIIIPQGKFHEFLHLKDKERTDMLKDIFDLKRFDLGPKVSVLEGKNNSIIENINGQLAQLSAVTAEELEVLTTEIKQLELDCQTGSKELEDLKLKLAHWQTLSDQVEKKKRLEVELQHLEQKAGFYQEKESIVKDYEYCLLNFKPLIENKSKARTEVKHLEVGLQKLEQKFQSDQAELEILQPKWEATKKAFESKDVFIQEIQDLKNLIQIEAETAELLKLRGRIEDGNKHVVTQNEKIETLKKELIEAEQIVENQKADLRDNAVLFAMKAWFQQKNNLQKTYSELEKDFKIRQTEFQTLLDNEKKKVSNYYFLVGQPEANWLTVLKSKTQELQTDISAKREQLSQAKAHEQLVVWSNALENGQPCPLCGALEHPYLLSDNELSESIKTLVAELKELENKQSELSEVEKSVSVFIDKTQRSELELERLTTKLAAATNEIELHGKTFIWTAYYSISENDLDNLLAKNQQVEKALTIAEAERKKISQLVEDDRAKYEKFKTAIVDLETKANQHSATINALTTQIKNPNLTKGLDANSIQNLLANKEKQLTSIQQDYTSISEKYEKLKTEVTTNASVISERKKQLEQKNAEWQVLENQFQQHLATSPFDSIEHILSILTKQIDTEKERREIETYKQQKHTTQTQLDEVKNNPLLAQFVLEEGELIKEQLGQKQLLQKEKEEERVRKEEFHKRLLHEKATKEALQADLDKLLLRKQDIQTLKNLFTGSKFVEYIATIYLKNLCETANVRFQSLAQNRLKLEFSDKQEIVVRDFLNNGQLRNIKTLSGGQTFQASLCLALALADSIHQVHKNEQNFFFLDEGFGTLDKESLYTVFQTLQSLVKENRIIGLISHVEDLQQEIGAYLTIVNDGEKGSLVKRSWEE